MADDFLTKALAALPPKPPDDAKQSEKKRYSEILSQAVALGMAAELRRRGLRETFPTDSQTAGGAERRMSGGIGAKKVDVTCATETGGLLLGVSIKSINFRDLVTHNYQKNLTNRRGDMLFEAVTLHRRFPYAVLVGLFFFHKDSATDGSPTRKSTFQNAHTRLQLFTGRDDPAGRDEQYERLYIVLHDPTEPLKPKVDVYLAGEPDASLTMSNVLDDIVQLVAERNSDFYEVVDGLLRPAR